MADKDVDSNPPLPPLPPRTVVTRVDQDSGRSSIWQSFSREPYVFHGAKIYNLWETNQSPADNTDEQSRASEVGEIVHPNGTATRLIDLPPGLRGPMHWTDSVDYGVVLKGTVTMLLDDGSVTDLHTGEVIVQRGANHAWENRTEEWVRLLFVIVPALGVPKRNEEQDLGKAEESIKSVG